MTPGTRDLIARYNRGGFTAVHDLPAAHRKVIVLDSGAAEVWEPRTFKSDCRWRHVADWPAARVQAWLQNSRRAA